jgi:hypothetical protein
VAVREQRDEKPIDQLLLAYDDSRDFLPQWFYPNRMLLHDVAQRAKGVVAFLGKRHALVVMVIRGYGCGSISRTLETLFAGNRLISGHDATCPLLDWWLSRSSTQETHCPSLSAPLQI